jgi:hypothetical protein
LARTGGAVDVCLSVCSGSSCFSGFLFFFFWHGTGRLQCDIVFFLETGARSEEGHHHMFLQPCPASVFALLSSLSVSCFRVLSFPHLTNTLMLMYLFSLEHPPHHSHLPRGPRTPSMRGCSCGSSKRQQRRSACTARRSRASLPPQSFGAHIFPTFTPLLRSFILPVLRVLPSFRRCSATIPSLSLSCPSSTSLPPTDVLLPILFYLILFDIASSPFRGFRCLHLLAWLARARLVVRTQQGREGRAGEDVGL